ncbi:hypothetical protein BaRGS_00009982 [Batillaria attramentaria]|uniref:Probable D-lactate dehydrogenase, mitochondrial n=1 Tax=Batillaria attramentaria TaxID=370345 RepID=A0ABD0LHD8_9CAEN
MFSSRFAKYLLSLPCKSAVRRRFSSQAVAEKVTDGFVEDLRNVVGKANVSTAEAVRDQHGHDESYHPTKMPDVVVFAQSVDHVSKVVKLCNDTGVPLIPFGSGTGLEGGINALKGGVCLDVSQMTNIVNVNAEDFDCTVESGVTRNALNSFIRDTGLWFPVDPGADASLCGMCSTSASGTNAVRYGTMRENVLNMEVVLANGNVIWTAGEGKRTKKTSAGYNLTNLFVGSEGTLGIITKATIRLYGIPESTVAAVVHFNNVQEAVDTTVQVLQCGIPMARIEFLDDVAIDAFNKYSKYDMKVKPSLFLEFHGSEAALEEQIQVVGSKPYSTDVCVPISHLPEVIVKSKEMIKNAGLTGPIVGHVGDGNFHVFFPVDPDKPEQLKAIKDVSRKMCLLAMDLNGTCTGEHGIGMGKNELLVKEVGPAGIEAMMCIKKAFDPNNILNPGKVFA